MKLWQKVSFISVMVLLMVVIICGISLLLYARDNILQITKEQAKYEQASLSKSFSEMANYYINPEDGAVVRQSAIKYCFSRFANNDSVLVFNGKTLFSQVSVQPETLLSTESKTNDPQQLFSGTVGNQNILIIGSRVTVYPDDFDVYVVKDVTSINNNMTNMMWRFIMISGLGILTGILLIVFLIKKTAKPLVLLKNISGRIAKGDYGERAEVTSRDEIGDLAVNFNAMADAVQNHVAHLEDTASRLKLFIGGLTHEFKTPMTSMILHSDTLLTTSLSEEDAENSLVHINTQCRWLERLTQKLLELITLGEGITTGHVSVQELLDDVAQSTKETLQTRGIPLVIECHTDTLELDYDLMKSLLINLVDNASKSSQVNQSVYLRAFDKVIEVSDQGCGIPQEELARVTDAFYMVDRSRSKLRGGSGLGLALVKEIAKAHNAQLVIESKKHHGTTVKIIFP